MPEKKKKKKTPIEEQVEKEFEALPASQKVNPKTHRVKRQGEVITGTPEAEFIAKRAALTRATVPAIKGAQVGTIRDPETGKILSQTFEREGLEPIQLQGIPPSQLRAQQQLEQQGAFEQVTPQETDLAPPSRTGSGIPLIGPATAGLMSAAAQAFPSIKGPKAETGETAFAEVTPESAREWALKEVSVRSYNEGISKAEAFGSFVEAVPIVGKLAAEYARGLIETPSSNAKTVLTEVNSERERAATGAEKVRNGLMDPAYGMEQARLMESNIADLKGRLKLLINTSPILRANADEVNRMQEVVLRAEERIAQFKQASAFGLTAQLTGTGRIIPTDEQLFRELQNLK